MTPSAPPGAVLVSRKDTVPVFRPKSWRHLLVSLRADVMRDARPMARVRADAPLRAELFSREQMAQHGAVLAGLHHLSPRRATSPLLKRLGDNETLLVEVRTLLTEAVDTDRRNTPAGEWLLDNFYLIEEHIRTARQHLPAGYSRELPRLADGPSASLPRVYDIALETISHGDGRLDADGLADFVAAYQTITPLRLGELWAIPIMLRLALIENLRRVAARIGADRVDRSRADYWAELLVAMADRDPKSVVLVVADMARSEPPMVGAFVAEFARRLQGKGPVLALPLTWVEQRLTEDGLTIELLIQRENQHQAADQVSVSNSISSLRFLGATDWGDFVAGRSLVEQTLRTDPSGVYPTMDFATRDQYRHVIEQTARRCEGSEVTVAEGAIALATAAAAADGPDTRHAHVGFYLIDRGYAALEQALHAHVPICERVRRHVLRHAVMVYLGLLAGLTTLLALAIGAMLHREGVEGWLVAVVSGLTLVCASQAVIALVNAVIPWLTTPRALPKLDFSSGLPAAARTLVVVPTMITTTQAIEQMVEALEVRFLGNRDDHIVFGLLTDLPDSDQETEVGDEDLVCLAERRIVELNTKYPGGPFCLFHRPRRWNPTERVWMGYERKRGKLGELNAFLRGRSAGQFTRVVGDRASLQLVKYVITLDADTLLPRDAARIMVGALMHPLNRARYDETQQRVTEGYGILQPRVAMSLPGAHRSRYARLWANDPGIDPYTRVTSDVYQDLFGEGSFIGKGIYDVDIFDRAVGDRFPDNRILSHDLIEGCYARSGLLTDVRVYEAYPARYDEDVRRRCRWIRGDWQLWRWLLPGTPGPDGRRCPNPLTWLCRWKLLDNLRRSLSPSALVVLLIVAWATLDPAWVWTLAAVGTVLLPGLVGWLPTVVRKPDAVTLRGHLTGARQSLGRYLGQSVIGLACLPHEAFYSVSAVARTMVRLLVTGRLLLEWTPSSTSPTVDDHGLLGEWGRMWSAPALAIGTAVGLSLGRPSSLSAAAPLLILWGCSPLLMWYVSRPLARRTPRLSTEQVRFLRGVARRTWAFFDTYVGPSDCALPPDNFQESPAVGIAHRTSPTNMGLALLANLSAHDFGFITARSCLSRTERALQTMRTMERHRGHFYNWYDTQSLAPLEPRYVSSVDSGNLAGYLLTLRSGLLAMPDEPLMAAKTFLGVRDTFDLTLDAEPADRVKPLTDLGQMIDAACAHPPVSLAAGVDTLVQLTAASRAVAAALGDELHAGPPHAIAAFVTHCQDLIDDLGELAPWSLSSAASMPGDCPVFASMPTLRDLAGLSDRWAVPARLRVAALERLAGYAAELAEMEWGFLFDATRHLLSIGYNVTDRRRDTSYYDLLASEARFSTFVAIAQGRLPQESWFALGRRLTLVGHDPVLLSWSGSMFEYLMPLVVMPDVDDTLLNQTYRAVVTQQIEYARSRGVPWGISESGYNLLDARLTYQYRAFGVPGLGLKRGLADDLVIAPYASALALLVAPEQACANLERLAAAGAMGHLGFYEAIDYTPARMPRGRTHVVVRSYMAHHQGMTLLAIAQVLLDGRMQARFVSEPACQATLLLLHERIPRATSLHLPPPPVADVSQARDHAESSIRSFSGPDTPVPEVQLLSNGRYHVMVTNAGGGYSRWNDIGLTRWREDTTRDHWGSFCYVKDIPSGAFWSTTHQPTLQPSERFETTFSEARAEFRCRTRQIESYTEIAVSPEDDVELRRLRLTNCGRSRRIIEVTSYAEVTLTTADADALHPAFSNLFVQTEVVREHGAILCTRRPRSPGETSPWMFHLLAVHAGASGGELSFETDRSLFVGRGRSPADPAALHDDGPLAGHAGAVLDPIVAIRARFVIEPEETVTLDFVSGVADSRSTSLQLVAKYQDRRLANRVFALASTHAQVVLRQLNATDVEAQRYCRLAGSILFANASRRADPSVIARNQRGQSGLWGYSVSGDLPIVLLEIRDAANLELVRQMVRAHAYWRLRGLAVDLVIWNEDRAGYRQVLQDQIVGLVAGMESNVPARSGAVFVRSAEQMSAEDRTLFQAVARIVMTDQSGRLEDQIDGRPIDQAAVRQVSVPRPSTRSRTGAAPSRDDLSCFNGIGGFAPGGREYVVNIGHGTVTPAPWVNVLANARFGSVVSESGSAYTWADNAHEYRLTPWHNDAVTDAGGEMFYLRDEESGRFWSPTAQPAGGDGAYTCRHGFGYSVFEQTTSGVRSELTVYVDLDLPVKWSVLTIRNHSGRPRRLSATAFVEWVLGDLRSRTAPHVVTGLDAETGAVTARNASNAEFGGSVAFFVVNDGSRSISGDRMECVGRNGSWAQPAAMYRPSLSGRLGAALDPCAALRVVFELAAGESRDIVFALGAGRDGEEAATMLRRVSETGAARVALDRVREYWNRTLGVIQVDTPDRALNVLANGWLLYQVLACRVWARSGAYQSGGAFGFRDQLQDVMALVHTEAPVVRQHLLRCASRQFPQGDVQHWWHPPSGRGVRSHCSDDYLWLPLATYRYVSTTGDVGILDESVPFIEGRPVTPEEDSYYDLPVPSEQRASLYEHCIRAIDHSLRLGSHGLPLMGSGDWNDGMNLVGAGGQGESVWLGFFLYAVLMPFSEIAVQRGDEESAARFQRAAETVRQSLEDAGWDGGWYRRAYFDDGTPLGSAGNSECQIDSIAQSWAVLSHAADSSRATEAMNAVYARLVRPTDRLVCLLDPPFDAGGLEPGYIKGYLPGVRENGGQYTHAAIWAAMAYVELGDAERAWGVWDLINPVSHALTPVDRDVYKVEPYVVSADVYAVSPHRGRGGWSWYTGSAAWMYRLAVESLLGVQRRGNLLVVHPCLPSDWPGFSVSYRFGGADYRITVHQTAQSTGIQCLRVDGLDCSDTGVPLVDDGHVHMVEVWVRALGSVRVAGA